MRRARAHGTTSRLTALVAVAAILLPGCSDPPADLQDEDAAVQAPLPVWSVPFAVRGRLESPGDLSYRCDGSDGRLSDEVFETTIGRALSGWNATGLVRFRPVRNGEEPDLTFSWASASHGTCRPFGVDFSVAHTGPVGPGNFVHFDAGHRWSPEGSKGESLLVVAAHEAGHVLGLDHSADPTALMYADAKRSEPTASDLAGLHSLYGGGDDHPDDLEIVSGSDALVMRRIAPAERTAWTLFDSDGDGRDELIVWRTDAPGIGAMTMYHFDAGPRLVGTIGPLLGVVTQGESPSFRTDAEGRRWILSWEPDGTRAVRLFDARGWIRPVTSEERLDAPEIDAAMSHDEQMTSGDLDGDGQPESVARRSAEALDG